MSDFKNQKEIFEYLLSGETVKRDNEYFKFNEKGFIINCKDPLKYCPTFDNPVSYEKVVEYEYQWLYESLDGHTFQLTDKFFTEDEIHKELHKRGMGNYVCFILKESKRKR